jgi:hypothetical protein
MGQMFSQQNQQQQNNNSNVPPPLPGYFIAVNGQQQGPFDKQTLQQMVQQGSFNRDMLVWKPGMQAWTKAADVVELNALFGSMPPPLPPQ